MNLTDKETEQVSNILMKIMNIESFDPNHDQFGAKSHQYQWESPTSLWDIEAFEKNHNIELPREYKIFMCFISDGAPFVGYGLYPFEKVEVVGDLSMDNILYPHMESEDFSALVTMYEKDLGKDATEEIYNGLLLIGTEGCGYDFGLVVSGKYKGRVLLTDGNLENPFIFSYDMGFLDLYERWLDAFEQGIDPSKVLLTLSKDVKTLLSEYSRLQDINEKKDVLRSLGSYTSFEDKDLKVFKENLENEGHLDLQTLFLSVLMKHDPQYVQAYLKKRLYQGNEKALTHFIEEESRYYDISSDYERVVDILPLLKSNPDTFSKALQLLEGSSVNTFKTFKQFLNDENQEIRIRTIHNISQTHDFREHRNELQYLLKEDDPRLVYAILQVLVDSTMTDEYLDVFKPLVEKFKDDDLIPSMIERYLHKIKVDLDYYK